MRSIANRSLLSFAARGCAVLLALGAARAQAQCEDIFADGFNHAALPATISGSATIQTSDLATHTWYYRVPTAPAPPKGRAVLIWLHGDGGSGNGFGAGFYAYTDADGAILVTPSGANNTWTHAADDLPGQSQDSQFISLLIDGLIANGVAGEPVDPNRIYLGGESRGAYMPYFLLQRPSTKYRFAGVAVNAGLLYCDAADADCQADASSAAHHDAGTPILHLHGTNDGVVTPPPTALFHDPVDWSVDWRVFSPMNLWAIQNGCFGGDNSTGQDDGVLQETYLANGLTANRYDLTGWGAACSRYQLILVENGGHVIGGQQQRIWSTLKGYCQAGGY
jgi:poly(3-hydroxybutyrate) depolymerase